MMTAVAIRPEKLKDNIAAALGAKVRQISVALDEVTVVVAAGDYLDAMRLLAVDVTDENAFVHLAELSSALEE